MSFLSYTRMQSVDVAVWGSVGCGGLLRVLLLVLNLQTKHVTASAALNPGRADDKHAVHTHTHTHTLWQYVTIGSLSCFHDYRQQSGRISPVTARWTVVHAAICSLVSPTGLAIGYCSSRMSCDHRSHYTCFNLDDETRAIRLYRKWRTLKYVVS